MIEKTITLPNKKLREISQEVKLPLSQEDEQIAKNLIHYLEMSNKQENELRPGIGIAAVQLGFLKRMFLVDFVNEQNERQYELLINPKSDSESEQYAALNSGEGCLSVKDTDKNQEGLVHRKNIVIVSGYSYFQKKNITIKQIGFGAIVFQHELDHLDGKLFIDRIDKKDLWKIKEKESII